MGHVVRPFVRILSGSRLRSGDEDPLHDIGEQKANLVCFDAYAPAGRRSPHQRSSGEHETRFKLAEPIQCRGAVPESVRGVPDEWGATAEGVGDPVAGGSMVPALEVAKVKAESARWPGVVSGKAHVDHEVVCRSSVIVPW